jgi:hypothetical protein
VTGLLTFGNDVWHFVAGILNTREADSHVLEKRVYAIAIRTLQKMQVITSNIN